MKNKYSIFAILLLLTGAPPCLASDMSSTNYVLQHDMISNGSGTASSASFSMTGISRSAVADTGYSSQFINANNVWFQSESVPIVLAGDLNNDGNVDVADALLAFRMTAGMISPTVTDLVRGDVAPMVNGLPQPDGKIDIGDVVVLLRRAVGLTTW